MLTDFFWRYWTSRQPEAIPKALQLKRKEYYVSTRWVCAERYGIKGPSAEIRMA